VLGDQERHRTTATFPDGSLRVQEFTGRLVVEYTNEATGASAVRNLPDDGGHFAAGLHPRDDPGPGFYGVDGHGWQVRSVAAGHRTLVSGEGTVEDVCQTLS